MWEIFSYPFMQRAILAGLFSAAILGYLGTFITTRKMSFLGDGIAHASLAGVAAALLFGWSPMPVAILTAIIIAILIYLLEKKAKVSSDSAIGVIFTTGMALGIIILNFYQGYQPELISYLFGNILTINQVDLFTIILVSLGILFTFFFSYRQLVFVTFDREGAYLSGIKPWKYDLLLYVVSAIAIVLSIKLVGIILVSALLVMPSTISKLFAHSFKTFVLWAVIIAIILVEGGLFLSYLFDLPSGATIIIFGAIFLFVSYLFKNILSKIAN